MDRSQVAVSVSESRVDLDGSGVAADSPLDVLHLLQSVAHVGVSVCKCWVDSAKEKTKL